MKEETHQFGRFYATDHHGRYRRVALKLLPVIPEEPELEEAATVVSDGRKSLPGNQETETVMVNQTISEDSLHTIKVNYLNSKKKESEVRIMSLEGQVLQAIKENME